MAQRIKRSPLRINFNKKNPKQFAFLNCVRKSLFIDDKFNVTFLPKFSLNEKEFQLWGYLIPIQRLGTTEKTKSGRQRCELSLETSNQILSSLKTIKRGDE